MPRDDYAPGGSRRIGSLSPNGARGGRINYSRDVDRFRIRLTAGHLYQFNMEGRSTRRGSLSDTYLRLRDARGRQLAFNDDGGVGLNSRINFRATSTGYYYLDASGFSTRTGSYRLSSRAFRDDYGSHTTRGLRGLSSTGSRTGRINYSGDVDRFRVVLRAGRTYQFNLEGSPTRRGSLRDGFLRLYDRRGRQVAFNDDGGVGNNARISFRARSSGTYYLDASGFGSNTGSYRVSSQIDDFAADTANATIVSTSGSTAGRIDYRGDVDRFRVFLRAGQLYQFNLEGRSTRRGTLSDSYLRLRDSAGRQIAANDDGGVGLNARIFYRAARTGTYYLDASAYRNRGTGSYRLSSTAFIDDFGSTNSSNGGSLRTPGTRLGAINFSGDVDRFRVSLSAGQTYQFDLEGSPTNAGTLRDSVLTLRNAVGTVLASNDDGGSGRNSRIQFRAATSGTYYLDASGLGSHTGSYRLTAQADDYTSGGFGTGSLRSIGGVELGRINYSGDVDRFRVSLSAGQTYQFDLQGASTSLGTLGDGVLTLRNAVGTILASNDDGGTGLNARIQFRAATSGTYYLDASGLGSSTGTYHLSSQADDYSSGGFGTGSLSSFGSSTRLGTINYSGDVDRFRISLSAGRLYQFDLQGASTGLGTLGDGVLTLRNAVGTVVASDDDSGTGLNSRILFQAASSGTYYLDVSGFADSQGTYSVSSQRLSSFATAQQASESGSSSETYRPPNLMAIQASQPLQAASLTTNGSILENDRRGALAAA